MLVSFCKKSKENVSFYNKADVYNHHFNDTKSTLCTQNRKVSNKIIVMYK